MCDESGQNNSPWTGWQFFTTLSSNRIIGGDVGLASNLNIYPNPTNGLFNISFVSDDIDYFELRVIDTYGKLIFNESKQEFAGEYTKVIDLTNWSKGIYVVQIKTKDSFVSKRVVLQ